MFQKRVNTATTENQKKFVCHQNTIIFAINHKKNPYRERNEIREQNDFNCQNAKTRYCKFVNWNEFESSTKNAKN